MRHMNRPTISEGDRFGKLKILSRSPSDRHGNAMYRCRCDCGNTAVVRGCHLRSGHTTSCGCARVDLVKGLNK
jgi:hypothetical protein